MQPIKNQHLYSNEQISLVKEIDANIYKKIVENMPIPCVDVFIYCQKNRSYLMVKRSQEPAKGHWWFAGGRMWKGESFIYTAKRKCEGEVGVSPTFVWQLEGAYNTIFPRSAWNCSTHTVNAIALAVLEDVPVTQVDDNHEACVWVKITENPQDDYLSSIYKKAYESLVQLGYCVNLEKKHKPFRRNSC